MVYMKKILDIITDETITSSSNQLDFIRFWLWNLYLRNQAAFVEASSRIFKASVRCTEIISVDEDAVEKIRTTWDIAADLLWFLNEYSITDDAINKAVEKIYERGKLYRNHPIYFEMERYFGRL